MYSAAAAAAFGCLSGAAGRLLACPLGSVGALGVVLAVIGVPAGGVALTNH